MVMTMTMVVTMTMAVTMKVMTMAMVVTMMMAVTMKGRLRTSVTIAARPYLPFESVTPRRRVPHTI